MVCAPRARSPARPPFLLSLTLVQGERYYTFDVPVGDVTSQRSRARRLGPLPIIPLAFELHPAALGPLAVGALLDFCGFDGGPVATRAQGAVAARVRCMLLPSLTMLVSTLHAE